MKIVEWDDDNVPPVEVLADGDGIVADCKYWDNLEVGDLIYYITEVGTSVYHVIDREPFCTDGSLGEGVYHVRLRAA